LKKLNNLWTILKKGIIRLFATCVLLNLSHVNFVSCPISVGIVLILGPSVDHREKEKVKDVSITTGQIKWFVNHLQK